MKVLKPVLARFARDESGAFIVLFGIMAVVLVALTGAVVDYTSLEEKRNRAQIALDGAALALQPRIFNSSDTEILDLARPLVAERFAGDDSVETWVDGIEINIVNGTLELRGGLEVRMNFVRLIGVETMRAGIVSEATRRKLALEVVMVLDNSGSMLEQNRMTHLKNAATCATRTLFYETVDSNCNVPTGTTMVDNVKMGIVPFTMYVNVGANLKNEYWLDWGGIAPVSQDNFDTRTSINGPHPYGTTVDREKLFANLKRSDGTSNAWAGCVVARQYPLDVDDTTPELGIPPVRPETLFTPLFVPDVRDGVTQTYISDTPAASCAPMERQQERVQNCNNQGNSCNAGSYRCRTRTTDGWTAWSAWQSNTCFLPGEPLLSSSVSGTSTKTTTTTYSLLTPRELQERVCKYNNVTYNGSTTMGPNAYCPTISILPLTNSPTNVINRINAMVADGGTNIHEGTAWGMRVLSPDEPFTEGAPYADATAKVMIVMTDGENTAYPANNMNGATYYSAYGFPYNERLGASGWTQAQLNAEMDKRTLETCTTAKELGMTVYTIGLSVTANATRTMLSNCATSPDHVFFPTHPNQLMATFADIAEQLAALRISR